MSVSVPYVSGDTVGAFADELIHSLSTSGRFVYTRDGGQVLLQVNILSSGSDKIGYKYDRKGKEAEREKTLVPTEGRYSICAQVALVDPCTNEYLYGPTTVTAYSDCDYVDYNSISDLSFVNSQGGRQSSIAFSLGQLDSIEGAQSDVTLLLYRQLAKKIVAGLIVQSCD